MCPAGEGVGQFVSVIGHFLAVIGHFVAVRWAKTTTLLV